MCCSMGINYPYYFEQTTRSQWLISILRGQITATYKVEGQGPFYCSLSFSHRFCHTLDLYYLIIIYHKCDLFNIWRAWTCFYFEMFETEWLSTPSLWCLMWMSWTHVHIFASQWRPNLGKNMKDQFPPPAIINVKYQICYFCFPLFQLDMHCITYS